MYFVHGLSAKWASDRTQRIFSVVFACSRLVLMASIIASLRGKKKVLKWHGDPQLFVAFVCVVLLSARLLLFPCFLSPKNHAAVCLYPFLSVRGRGGKSAAKTDLIMCPASTAALLARLSMHLCARDIPKPGSKHSTAIGKMLFRSVGSTV